jgi:hypothetical protein
MTPELTEEDYDIDDIRQVLDRVVSDNQTSNFDPVRNRDETRSEIALIVVKCFFLLIGIVLVGVPVYNVAVVYQAGGGVEMILSVKDLVLVVSGVISGPFGFVVGYYFKGVENEQFIANN